MKNLASSNIRDSYTGLTDKMLNPSGRPIMGMAESAYMAPSICLPPENPAQPGLPVPLPTAKPTLHPGIDQNGALYIKISISEEPRQAKPCGTQRRAMDREGSKDARRDLGCSVAKRQSQIQDLCCKQCFSDMIQTALQFG